MDCGQFDTTGKLETLIKNMQLTLLPSPLWAIHVDPKYEYVAILHAQLIHFSKVAIDKGILITYDEIQDCIKTAILIHNEIISVPSLQYTVHTVSDLSQLIYNLHQLTLCRNSNNSLEYPHCIKYVKIENYDKLCSACNLNTNEDFYDYTEIDSFSCNTQGNIEPLLNNYMLANPCMEITERNYTCSYCNDTFTSIDGFNDHLESKCNKVIEEPIEVNNVNLSQSNIEEEGLHCADCDKTFSSKEQLKEHVRLHTGKKPYTCTICNKSNSHRSSHYKHVLSHSVKKPNLCNICGKTFCKGYKMEDHMLTHSEEKPYECNLCHKKYATRNNLRIHEESHKGNRPYSCKTCNKTFTTPSNLSTHVKSIHNKVKPHQCGVCNMSFLYPQLLKIHMRKHTGEKPYKCVTCGKSFSKKIHLTVHERTHSGEKPFICSICGKGFTTTGNLSSHKRVHVKET